jgi:hypothetical protein
MGEWLLSRRDSTIVARHEVPGAESRKEERHHQHEEQLGDASPTFSKRPQLRPKKTVNDCRRRLVDTFAGRPTSPPL